MALLEVQQLRAGYGFPVLMGISFEVDQGETAVLFGLNGAGKTTTVHCIAGVKEPDGGSIVFDGEEVGGRAPSELVRKGISLCPEGRRVFPELTVENNLRLGAWSRRHSSGEFEKAKELAFEYFPVLGDRAYQMAGTLSGGEQQMLAIARAMMSQPKLMLVDEASLGLSPLLAQSVFKAVNRINQSGTTVIIVEQNVGVLPYADRVLILEKGTLVFSGRGKDVSGADLRAQYLGGTASRDGRKKKAAPRRRKAKARR